jgi:hypothetical protein
MNKIYVAVFATLTAGLEDLVAASKKLSDNKRIGYRSH